MISSARRVVWVRSLCGQRLEMLGSKHVKQGSVPDKISLLRARVYPAPTAVQFQTQPTQPWQGSRTNHERSAARQFQNNRYRPTNANMN